MTMGKMMTDNENEQLKQEKLKKRRYIILGIICLLLLIFFLTPYGRSLFIRLKGVFSSQEQLQQYVESYGILAPLIFLFIQTLQVIIAPIPGNITTLAGGAVFGVWEGFLYGTIGIVTGSVIAYWLARFYGKPLVIRLVGSDMYNKYADTFIGRSFIVLLTVFLFPFFPDDALCLIAGISKIKFGLFILLVVIGRSPGILLTSYIGAGVIKLVLWQWIVIAVISLTLIVLSFKFGNKVEEYFKKIYKSL
ncbi:MAG: TVP38/TMEM64 family protein [Clostridia bacterium]|nr:TVP38/TMEM64 family protein [Clostridia bacterium]